MDSIGGVGDGSLPLAGATWATCSDTISRLCTAHKQEVGALRGQVEVLTAFLGNLPEQALEVPPSALLELKVQLKRYGSDAVETCLTLEEEEVLQKQRAVNKQMNRESRSRTSTFDLEAPQALRPSSLDVNSPVNSHESFMGFQGLHAAAAAAAAATALARAEAVRPSTLDVVNEAPEPYDAGFQASHASAAATAAAAAAAAATVARAEGLPAAAGAAARAAAAQVLACQGRGKAAPDNCDAPPPVITAAAVEGIVNLDDFNEAKARQESPAASPASPASAEDQDHEQAMREGPLGGPSSQPEAVDTDYEAISDSSGVAPASYERPRISHMRMSTLSMDSKETDEGGSFQEHMFELRPIWTEHPKNICHRLSGFARVYSSASIFSDTTSAGPDIHWFVMRPFSIIGMTWNFLGAISLLYDIAMVPVQLFDPPVTVYTEAAGLATGVYWSMDLVLSFFKAYYSDGTLVSKPALVARKYVATWFPVDLVVVAIDWTTLIARKEGLGGISRMGRSLRFLRALRSIRLLRVAKLGRMLGDMQAQYGSASASAHLSLVKLLFLVLLMNHFLACFWFGVGLLSEEEEGSWVHRFDVFDKPFGMQYTMAFHWSLAQFGVGAVDVYPRTEYELVFTVFVLLFALFAFSSLVSSITNSISSLRALKKDEIAQFGLLRRFFQQHLLSKDLKSRIHSYIEYKYHYRQKMLAITDVALLNLLSLPLLQELREQIYTPYLDTHAFFRKIGAKYPAPARQICNNALSSVPLASKDTLFSAGELARRAYLVIGGELIYLRHRHPSEGICFTDWISEAALWTAWIHHGRAQATCVSELLTLEQEELAGIVFRHPEALAYTKKYARKFIAMLNALQEDDKVELVSDLLSGPAYVGDFSQTDSWNPGPAPVLLKRRSWHQLVWFSFQSCCEHLRQQLRRRRGI